MECLLEPAFVALGMPVLWLELIAFTLALANIGCNVCEVHWGWPLSIAASGLYAWFFVHSGIYGEAGVNLFFAALALWGWWQWLRGRRRAVSEVADVVAVAGAAAPLRVAAVPRAGLVALPLAWLLLWGLCGLLLGRLTGSDVPWWDGFVTAGSIVGAVLLARKYIENWPVWVVVNIASIGLFWHKALPLTTLLYAILLALACVGWWQWRRKLPLPAGPAGA
ncbi:nicotinamide riboside transporter PnuC [Corticibacter populi]|uniref:Nicotinamide riboside transporter PnuC n=1 Tax=Corticibacter populi TaxID=1550736 RepID=A0A3M6QHP1_9BURK|nr:nicotinamide riboside transporter PnuC [Corticibacter populi]RMX02613.1 nicotinamide riboside transporter PnuC [Corticibacter populi]RZS32972.1 nicotinamide mononucleotide transporter [Corticibacter populi]